MEEAYFDNCPQITDLSFLRYLTKIQRLSIKGTNIDRTTMADWLLLPSLRDFSDGENAAVMHQSVKNSFFLRRKITKLAKKIRPNAG